VVHILHPERNPIRLAQEENRVSVLLQARLTVNTVGGKELVALLATFEEENRSATRFRYRVIVEGRELQAIDPLRLHCKDPTVEQVEIRRHNDTIKILPIAASEAGREPVCIAHLEAEMNRIIIGKRRNVCVHAQQVELGFTIAMIVQDVESDLLNGTEHQGVARLPG